MNKKIIYAGIKEQLLILQSQSAIQTEKVAEPKNIAYTKHNLYKYRKSAK